MQGLGVAVDYAEAARWSKLAADKGHGGAAYNLANRPARPAVDERDQGLPGAGRPHRSARHVPRARYRLESEDLAGLLTGSGQGGTGFDSPGVSPPRCRRMFVYSGCVGG
jgi:TPR repeat protein